MPMIAASHSAVIVQALLYDGPLAVRRDDEAVQINLKAVGDRVVVDARGQTAGADQGFAIETTPLAYLSQFVWRVAREAAAAAANVDAEFVCTRSETALERAHHGSSDSRRMPIHSHHRAQRLKPEWIAQTREKRRGAVIVNNRFRDRSPEPGHSLRQPKRHMPTMQRQISNSRTLHDFSIVCSQVQKSK